jgi:tRNA(fMet)-specific endonuclease VapC
LIDAERGASKRLGALIGDEDDVAIAAVTAAELTVGVELADDRKRRPRAAFVAAVLEAVSVEPYDLDVARVHGALLAYVRRSGRPRGAHDLIIAATARARGREVVTADPEGTVDLPEVSIRETS